jgi:hypothetical protein
MTKSKRTRVFWRLSTVIGLAATTLPLVAMSGTAPAAPAPKPTVSTPDPFLTVVTAHGSRSPKGPQRGGLPITKYKWLIQQDNSGDPNQLSGPLVVTDATITPGGGTATITSPSAPFLTSDAIVAVSGPGLASNATIATVSDAKTVVLSAGAYSGGQVNGTYSFSVNRPDPCHPQTKNQYGDPNFPAACNWPSIHLASNAPVVTQGNETDWSPSQHLSGINPSDPTKTRKLGTLPNGKYLVSVTADGYEIGGASFSVPWSDTAVKVLLNPGPVPLGTLKIQTFDDMAPTGAAYATETEHGLAGFTAHITDFIDEVTQDYFGNPLCTSYAVDPTTKRILLDGNARPTVAHLGGKCLSDANGLIEIPNLAMGRYGVSVVPPDTTWIQTTTLEGAHDFDVWLEAGSDGLDSEMVQAGEPVPFVHFGYVKQGCKTGSTGNFDTDFTPCNADPNGGVQYSSTAANGGIKGKVVGAEPYVPGIGGLAGVGGANGQAGLRLDNRPIPDAWIALSDLNDGDQTKFSTQANPDGTFSITNVPDGSYNVAVWDKNQDYAFDAFQVDVANGRVVDLGAVPLLGWFTRLEGHVFIDRNGNGKQDPGEPGVPDFLMQMLNRTNNTNEQGQKEATTNDAGFYQFKEAYPLGQFSVLQFFNTRFRTTGTTCQADNDPQEHTTLTPAVDLSSLNIIGLNGRCDIGVQPYSMDPAANDNGGIVATAVYHSLRTEYTAEQATQLLYDTGLPDVRFELWKPHPDGKGGYVKDASGALVRDPVPIDPSKGQIGTYYSERYGRPPSCTPRAADGTVLTDTYQDAIKPGGDCVETSMQGTASGFGTDNLPVDPTLPICAPRPDGTYDPACPLHGVQTVDGNYTLTPPAPGDYIVHVQMPTDMFGKPKYQWSTEANVNSFDGPGWVPQAGDYSKLAFPVLPVANSAGAAPRKFRGPGIPLNRDTTSPSPHAKCAGPQRLINNTVTNQPNYVPNPNYVAATAGHGGPWEGRLRPLCDSKLLHVQNGQSIAPSFFMYTDVPLATKFSGYMVDDISVSTNRKSVMMGEVAGIGGAPIGVYDWAGRYMQTITSDPNGQWEALLPSTNTFNCLSAAGPCPTTYRFVGNDPGNPAQPNLNWNPAYRTISANFQAWPNVFSPADVAPSRTVISFEGQGSQFMVPAVCSAKASEPQLFAISKPYINQGAGDVIGVDGVGFGTSQGNGKVTLLDRDTTQKIADLTVATWSDTHIDFTVPSGTAAGPYQLMISNNNGLALQSGLTFHVLGGAYNPTVYEVGPGKTYDPGDPRFLPPNAQPGDGKVKGAIQRAIEAAANAWVSQNADPTQRAARALVVVYPNTPQSWTPLGAYFESIILHAPIELQGVGPGGMYNDASGVTHAVAGTTIDGRFFTGNTANPENVTNNDAPLLGNEPWAFDWMSLLGLTTTTGILQKQGFANNDIVPDGEVVLVVGNPNWYTADSSGFRPTIDGMTITGGDQKGFPANLSEVNGVPIAVPPDETFFVDAQGGGIMLLAQSPNWQISNNLVQSNSGTYGGAIRSGSPQLDPAEGDPNAHNDALHIHHNRLIANGGTNLAGAVGLFKGTSSYRIDHNTICGNLSAEYGAGISHFGLSPGGEIDHNKILLNQAIDEGGGMIIAGEPRIDPNTSIPNPSLLSEGAGAVKVHDNFIGSNLANDDGGGIRFLQAGNFPFDVYNNMITNNVSTHQGGGIAIDDAPQVRIYNNTIAKNLTTATAVTSNGQPAPAGVSTNRNSNQLQASLSGAEATLAYSKPLLANNVFWDNRAGSWDPVATSVRGIGLAGDTTPVNRWDVGAADLSDGGLGLPVVNSVLQSTTGAATDSSDKVGTDPVFKQSFDTGLDISPWRLQPHFRPTALVTVNLPANLLGDYHLTDTTSPAAGIGSASLSYFGISFATPVPDVDGDPQLAALGIPVGVSSRGGNNQPFDAGADQVSPATAKRLAATTGATAIPIPLAGPAAGMKVVREALLSAPGNLATAASPVHPAAASAHPATGGPARPAAPARPPATGKAASWIKAVPPPAGAIMSTVRVGAANGAGNTAVVPVAGRLSGSVLAKAGQVSAAGVPGGVIASKNIVHRLALGGNRPGRDGDGGLLLPYALWAAVLSVLAVGIAGRRARSGRSHSTGRRMATRGVVTGPQLRPLTGSPPTGSHPSGSRPVPLAEDRGGRS